MSGDDGFRGGTKLESPLFESHRNEIEDRTVETQHYAVFIKDELKRVLETWSPRITRPSLNLK